MTKILFVCHGRICLKSKNLDKTFLHDRISFSNGLPIFFGVATLLMKAIKIGDKWQE